MKKILEHNPNISIPFGFIFMGIGGIWMSDSEEKNIIQLVLIVLGGSLAFIGAVIGLVQNRKIIKKSKDQ